MKKVLSQDNKSIQNVAINLCKIIACFLVIINHTSTYILNFNNNGNLLFYCIQFVFCRIAVPIFIICTGYLLSKKNLTAKYIFFKFFKIFILTIVFSGIIYFYQNPNFGINNIIIFFKQIISNPIIEPYWYLYMLMGLYLIIPLINKMISKFKWSEYLYAIFIILIIPSILNLFSIQLSNYFLMNNLCYSIGYYIIGAFLRYLFDQKKDFKIKEWYLWLTFLTLNLIGIVYMYSMSINNNSVFNTFLNSNSLLIIINATLFVTLMLIHFKRKPLKTDLSILSSLTLGIYLLHPIIQNKIYELDLIQNLFYKNSILGIIILQIIIFISCSLLVYLFKKISSILLKTVKHKEDALNYN